MDTTLTFDITEVAFGGKAVGRHEGRVVFVPGALPGETVRVALTREHRTYADARLVEVLTPSPARVAPACPLAMRPCAAAQPWCVGCSYQHAAYPEELQIKAQQLRSLLTGPAGVAADRILPPVPAPLDLGYRNKIVLHAQGAGDGVALGYVGEDNRTVLDVPVCPLAVAPINALLAQQRAAPRFLRTLRAGRTVTVRYTARDGALLWQGAAEASDVWLVEASALGPLSVPRNSFYQVNPLVGDLLIEAVSREIRERAPERVVDLFCGIGLFALAAAAQGVSEVVGADRDEEAIRAADYNAHRLDVNAVRWLAASAEQALRELGAALRGPRTLAVLDPPRGGLGQRFIQRLLRNPPGTLLYISCAPDTLARDLAWLRAAGYEVEHSRLYDMFPRTRHFETATVLVGHGLTKETE